MNAIYVTGHRNPDTDSVCAAWAYAELKRLTDSTSDHLAVRCGPLNPQTRFVFDTLGIQPPPFIKTILPTVADVMTRTVVSMGFREPILTAIRRIDELHVLSIPVTDDEGRHAGSIGVTELARYLTTLVSGAVECRPSNIARLVDGRIISAGRSDAPCMMTPVICDGTDGLSPDRSRDTDDRCVLAVGDEGSMSAAAVYSRPFPVIIITSCRSVPEIPRDCTASVITTPAPTEEVLRLLPFCCDIETVMDRTTVCVRPDDTLDHARSLLLGGDRRSLPVLVDGRIEGILTRSDLIKPVRKRLILVDHNETSQSIDGADTAEIVEIIDHHRLGATKTRTPIHIYARPVGSTCTLVTQLWQREGKVPGQTSALLLLSGILSDTVILKSPTTTDEDREAVEMLSGITGIDIAEWGIRMFSTSGAVAAGDPGKIVEDDLKIYEEQGVRIGIGQVEVVTLEQLGDKVDMLEQAVSSVAAAHGLDWAMLLVTDIISENSMLLTNGFCRAEKHLSYRRLPGNRFDLPGVLSRKKQLLPEVLRALEEMASSRL